jgi:DNA-binding protein YbaB
MADQMQVKREIVVEADAETLERMRKEAMRAALPSIAMKANGSAATIPRRRPWLISVCRWLFDC